MKQKAEPDECRRTIDDSLVGLYIAGTIHDRTRRMVPYNNPKTEIVTYVIETTGSKKYYVDDYAPSNYLDRGAYVILPVYVKPYRKNNGDPSYTLCLAKEYINPLQGESF